MNNRTAHEHFASRGDHTRRTGILSNLLQSLVSVVLLLAFVGWVSQALAGQAQLAWNAPTTNTDGSPLTDLAGYHLYYWQGSTGVPHIVDVGNTTNYTLTGLMAGATYTFWAYRRARP